jgi:GTP pyrophosphokinase
MSGTAECNVRDTNLTGHMQEMDWETIVAGLLHDTVEDTEHVTFERIEDQFGPAVRRIVEGETKASLPASKKLSW